MKYAIIPYIALGLVLSLAIGIEYNCDDLEMFPTYYGSPLVFKQKSLGSSMEYFYSISGLIVNVLIWSFFLFLIDKAIQVIIEKLNTPKPFLITYRITIGLMIVFTSFNIAIDYVMIGNGFEKELNYWYWNVDENAKVWRVKCKGKILVFKFER